MNTRRSEFIRQAIHARRSAGLTQEKAARMLDVGSSTLQKYEVGTLRVQPDIAMSMAKIYHDPSLVALYCETECPIGEQKNCYRHDASIDRLMLDILASDEDELPEIVKTMHKILADGIISTDERPSLNRCLVYLDDLAAHVSTLRLKVQTLAEQSEISHTN